MTIQEFSICAYAADDTKLMYADVTEDDEDYGAAWYHVVTRAREVLDFVKVTRVGYDESKAVRDQPLPCRGIAYFKVWQRHGAPEIIYVED